MDPLVAACCTVIAKHTAIFIMLWFSKKGVSSVRERELEDGLYGV